MKSKKEIVDQFNKHLATATSALSKQYENNKRCQAFYAGDTMAYKDTVQYTTLGGQKQKAQVMFNRVAPYVDAVKGFMIQNRRRAKYDALADDDDLQTEYTRYANNLLTHCRLQSHADQVETQQDGDLLICGYGATSTAMSYGDGYATTNPNGQILKGRLDPNRCFWDASARATNLLDARYVGFWQDYALEDALQLFEDSEPEDFDDVTMEEMKASYSFYPRGGRYDKIRRDEIDWASEEDDVARVHFYEWFEIETYYRAENPIYKLTNPQAQALALNQLQLIAQEFGQDQDDSYSFNPQSEILSFNAAIRDKLLEHFGEYVTVHPFRRKVYYTAVVSRHHCFTAYRSPHQQGFTQQFKTGKWDDRNKMWVGLVQSMMEPVDYYNKALTELMFIIGANSKGGVMVERTAVKDIRKFEQQYARTDAVCIVEDGAITNNRIRDKKSPAQPTGYEDIIRIAETSVAEVVGIDKTFLGSSENKQETGILQRRRVKQVVSTLAQYFDSVTLYQECDARLMLTLMKIYAANNDGTKFKVLGENGKAAYERINSKMLINDYDIQISEAPLGPEDRAEMAEGLQAVADKFLTIGDTATAKLIYAISLKYVDIDADDRTKLLQVLMPQDQKVDPAYVQQLEQQLQVLMSEVTQADVKKKGSEVEVNKAKADNLVADTLRKISEANKIEAETAQTAIENNLASTAAAQISINI